LIIRLAEAKDDVAVGNLLVDAFVISYAKKMPWVVVTEERKTDLRAVAKKRAQARVFVAEHPILGIVGTVALFPPGAEGSEAWIPTASDLRHLALNPHHKVPGASAALMKQAEDEAWRLGSTAVCLHVRRGADGVAGVYTKRGYVRAPEGDMSYPTVELDGFILQRS
jgi:predicted N-acetyltransferase YhbS